MSNLEGKGGMSYKEKQQAELAEKDWAWARCSYLGIGNLYTMTITNSS